MGLFSGKRPSDLGVTNGALKAPPSSPNAVSSQAAGGYHRIAPLTYESGQSQAMETIKAIVGSTPNTRIVETRPDYLYAEYASALLGFVDDVEFYFSPGAHIIHVRSASRLGHSDFGVNRKRIEAIRARLLKSGAWGNVRTRHRPDWRRQAVVEALTVSCSERWAGDWAGNVVVREYVGARTARWPIYVGLPADAAAAADRARFFVGRHKTRVAGMVAWSPTTIAGQCAGTGCNGREPCGACQIRQRVVANF